MGYVTISNELVDELSPHEILVYVGIKRHYPKAHPSLQRIADVCGLSLAAVKRALKSLRARGLVLVRRTGRSNWYVVKDDLEKALPEPSDGSDRAIRKLSQSHKEEQLRTPSEEDKTMPAARAGEDRMKQVRMDEDPPPERRRSPEQRARDHAVLAWQNEANRLGVRRWNAGLLNKFLSELRREYGWDQVEALMARFFTEEAQAIRMKTRGGMDLSVMFRQAFNQGLEKRAEAELRRIRSGEPPLHETVGAARRAQAEEYMRKYADG